MKTVSRPSLSALMALALALLAGCDMLGIESPEKIAATRDAEGRAVGSACRHAGRAIEDCYALNRKADKASVFAGWRDMNDYMRENKIDEVAPQLGAAAAKSGASGSATSGVTRGADSAADKAASKADQVGKPKSKDAKDS